MSDVNDRVFPTFIPNKYGGEGLTKRELIAAMILAAKNGRMVEFTVSAAVEESIRQADALLAGLAASEGGG